MEELLDRLTKRMRRRFLNAVNRLRSPEQLRRLAALIQAGRPEEALRVADDLAAEVSAAGADVYVRAGAAAAQAVGSVVGISLAFDQANPRALDALSRQRFDLVQALVTEQKDNLRRVLLEGSRQGLNPRVQARMLGDSLGLTPGQMQAVANYRRLLEEGSQRATRRALHDSRVKDVRNLTPAQIDRLVDNYRTRYIRYRAEVVARTEALRAVNQGTSEMFEQLRERGIIDQEVSQQWHTARDSRVRGHHRSMHGQVREIGEPFISGRGNRLLYPGDPSAPANDVVQCRCVVLTRYTVDQDNE